MKFFEKKEIIKVLMVYKEIMKKVKLLKKILKVLKFIKKIMLKQILTLMNIKGKLRNLKKNIWEIEIIFLIGLSPLLLKIY